VSELSWIASLEGESSWIWGLTLWHCRAGTVGVYRISEVGKLFRKVTV